MCSLCPLPPISRHHATAHLPSRACACPALSRVALPLFRFASPCSVSCHRVFPFRDPILFRFASFAAFRFALPYSVSRCFVPLRAPRRHFPFRVAVCCLPSPSCRAGGGGGGHGVRDLRDGRRNRCSPFTCAAYIAFASKDDLLQNIAADRYYSSAPSVVGIVYGVFGRAGGKGIFRGRCFADGGSVRP